MRSVPSLPCRGVFGCHPIGWIICILILSAGSTARGLIEFNRGNEPVQDGNWPAGSLALANLKIRLLVWEGPPLGGGESHFLYRGDTRAFQRALDMFAEIKAPGLELQIHEGPMKNDLLKDDKDPNADTHVDWEFTVWNPASWNQLFQNRAGRWNADDPRAGKPVPAPRLDVYLGGVKNGIEWSKLRLPPNVTIGDDRASSNGYKDGSAMVGDVIDMDTSKPLAGATITLTRNKGQNEKNEYVYETVASVRSDAKGHFELRKIPAGAYEVVATASGYASRAIAYEHFGSDTFRKYETQLAAAVTLSGTVVDTAGKAVGGITLRADTIVGPGDRGYGVADRPQVTSDKDGKFAIAGLPRGHCSLFAYAKGYLGTDVLKVYDVPASDVQIKVTSTGTVRGRVLKPDGAPPDYGYMVHIAPEGGEKIGSWGGGADLKPDGTYEFDGVPPGKYEISARPNPGPALNGKDPDAVLVEVKPGEITELDFKAKPPG